jgi:hypothetical protein
MVVGIFDPGRLQHVLFHLARPKIRDVGRRK